MNIIIDSPLLFFFLQVIASEILWFAQNKFLISLSHEDKQNDRIEIYYVEIDVREFKCTKCISYCDLALPSQHTYDFEFSSYFKAINKWYD